MSKSIEEREAELRLKNKLLEDRRRQLEEQLQGLNTGSNLNLNDEEEQDQNKEEEEQEQKEVKKDMIGQLQAINKIQQQRNRTKYRQLKQKHAKNTKTLSEQQKQIDSLHKAMQEASRVYLLKIDTVKQLQSKGKKLSQQSKKWIGQITKLSQKAEGLRSKGIDTSKDWQKLNQQLVSLDKDLKSSQKQKKQLQLESNSFEGKINGLNQQITLIKQSLRANAHQVAQEANFNNKEAEKLRINQKRLERQKAQLIKAYRKLNSYIALLRKQNLHIQMSKSLNFSLQEFLQGVDKSDRI